MINIVIGWTDKVLSDFGLKEIPTYAVDRAEICSGCESKIQIEIVDEDICKECGCILSAKTLVKNEKCPKGKW
jgi:hypothetical protein